MNNITVATFNVPAHAEPLRKRLEQEGIPALVHDDSKLERMWFVSKPLAGVRVDVPERDFERTLKLFKSWGANEEALRDAVRCPECASSRIEYPQFTRKFLLPNLVGLFSAIGLVQKEYYCQDCHYTWPSKENNRPEKPNPHGAPNYFIEGAGQPPAGKDSHPTS
jgi:hypothetical protein